jgi:hypothetical protein
MLPNVVENAFEMGQEVHTPGVKDPWPFCLSTSSPILAANLFLFGPILAPTRSEWTEAGAKFGPKMGQFGDHPGSFDFGSIWAQSRFFVHAWALRGPRAWGIWRTDFDGHAPERSCSQAR